MARPYKKPVATKSGRSRLAQWWRELRIGADLDQKSAAKALGCSATHISNIEHGRRLPSFALVTRFDEVVEAEGVLRSMWEWAVAERAAEQTAVRRLEKGRQVPGDRSQFVRDLFPRGDALFEPRKRFTAGWEIRNIGSVTWRDRFLQQAGPRAPLYGPTSLADRAPVPTTRPGETAAIKMPMMAPQLPGQSITYFRMIHADGAVCFPDRYADGVYVRIEVREPTQLRR